MRKSTYPVPVPMSTIRMFGVVVGMEGGRRYLQSLVVQKCW